MPEVEQCADQTCWFRQVLCVPHVHQWVTDDRGMYWHDVIPVPGATHAVQLPLPTINVEWIHQTTEVRPDA